MLEDEPMALDVASTRGILPRGGTILGTSRTNVFAREDGAGRRSRATFDGRSARRR